METMTNREKAQEIINKQWEWIADFIEKNNLSKEDRNQIRFKMYGACLDMAEWTKQQLIDETCKWLAKNDSYAIPTNVQVDRLREHLNNIK